MAITDVNLTAAFRANAFLRSLSAADAGLIAPMMTLTAYRAGARLGLAPDVNASLHFPVTLVASMGLDTAQGGRGLIGREGLIGWPAILGLGPDAHGAQVLFDGGTALVLPVRRMQVACFASPTLTMALLRFVQAYTVQLSTMLEHSGCASLAQRLSAWLLMLHDRIEGDAIAITHLTLAAHLGVRRASITDALHRLEGEQALRCDRRVIHVRDRVRLEVSAGRVYGGSEAAYRRSIGAFGKSQPDTAPDRRAAPSVSFDRTHPLVPVTAQSGGRK